MATKEGEVVRKGVLVHNTIQYSASFQCVMVSVRKESALSLICVTPSAHQCIETLKTATTKTKMGEDITKNPAPHAIIMNGTSLPNNLAGDVKAMYLLHVLRATGFEQHSQRQVRDFQKWPLLQFPTEQPLTMLN